MIRVRALSTLAIGALLAACASAPSSPRYANAQATRMLPPDVTVLSTSPALLETTPILVARRGAKAPAATAQATQPPG